ncbi:GCN5-related N-acetyltransferase [Flavobacteriaceae bacterium 3519-10]|nr:GCN5-related N-acetyltransferase [Flavobacteriaceae bacterium 3519-10]
MSDKDYNFRRANSTDEPQILTILQQAIERRRLDGSQQWQDGYPNPETVTSDIAKGWGYVIEIENSVAAYVSIIYEPEPAYEAIDGSWLSTGEYVVMHRVAVADEFTGRGLATEIFREAENIAKRSGVSSIKVDTNFDNVALLHILKKLGYKYCGEVYFRGSARKAFEKLL